MRAFVIATTVGLVLATGLTTGTAPDRAQTSVAVVDSTQAIPWLCRMFGLCCER